MLQIPTPPPAEPRQPIEDTDETNNFCPISLRDWLALCRKTGVPHIPAEQISTVQAQDWLMFDTVGEHRTRLTNVRREIYLKLKPEHMLRYDFCAPLETKIRLGSGRPDFDPAMAEFILDDPRAYDILWEFPRETVPIFQRPWIQAQMQDGYPVEYRVFVKEGRIQGVSSYYPQRPLNENENHLEQVKDLTLALIKDIRTPFLWPTSPMREWVFARYGRGGVHFTADYLVTAQGDVLFIEGGPPHEMGAHPCCFRHGEIEGVALTDRNDPNS